MKADLLRKLAKDFRIAGQNRLANKALIALAKETGSPTPRSDLSYSYVMRKLRKDKPERLHKFMVVFKQAFDKAFVEEVEDPDNAALMEALQAVDYKSDQNDVKDKIPGGLADKGEPKDLNPKQLEKGIKIEMEHTDDEDIAREIATDHLTEDPLYYDKLEKIESSDIEERMVKLAEYMVTMDDPAMAARGIAVIINFLTRRIEPNKRLYSLLNLKRKIYELDEYQIASKKSPNTASLGQSITFLKTILNGRPPYYIRKVINEVVKNI